MNTEEDMYTYIGKKWKDVRQQRHLLVAEAMNFYTLEALAAAAGQQQEWFSKGALKRDITSLKTAHERQFAAAIFDYLCLAMGGEARWAIAKSDFFIPALADFEVSRTYAQKRIMAFNPEQFLPLLEELFSAEWAGVSYGGGSWARIAQAARMYGVVPDPVFIDHCVDLKHNGGLVFDKEVVFSPYQPTIYIKDFLTMKSRKGIEEWCDLILDQQVIDLLRRALAVGYISAVPQAKALWEFGTRDGILPRYEDLIDNYEQIVWGTEDIGALKSTGRVFDEDEDDLDDDDLDDGIAVEFDDLDKDSPEDTGPDSSVTFSSREKAKAVSEDEVDKLPEWVAEVTEYIGKFATTSFTATSPAVELGKDLTNEHKQYYKQWG